MLEAIGTIKAILNDELVLVESESPLKEDKTLLVFQRIPKESLGVEIDLEALDLPKGHVKVILQQSTQLYLAERFERTAWKKRIERGPGGLLEQLGNVLGDRVIEEELPAGWSAEFETTASLGVSMSRLG